MLKKNKKTQVNRARQGCAPFIPFFKQESPPVWTQEPYRPRRIKYSICCPVWGRGGYPIPAGGSPSWVTPILTEPGGYPIPAGGYPILGTPPPVLTWLGGTPSLPGEYPILGTPCPDLAGVYPIPAGGTPFWVPPILTWPGGTGTWLGYPPPSQEGYPPPPPVDRQTDGQPRVKT